MYLVSSCLAGIKCRYNGNDCENRVIVDLVKQGKAIPVCPEQLAGLPTPRACCEIVFENGVKKVISQDGRDVTKEYVDGAEKTLGIAISMGISQAIFKSRSPTCGCGCLYDGTFAGKLIKGNGIAAELLLKNGISVYTENDLDELQI